jgi:hypothetical protein
MKGLIVDWGGVLTMPIHTAIGSWLKASGVDHNHYGEVVRRWVEPLPGDSSPVHRLERGELAVEDLSTCCQQPWHVRAPWLRRMAWSARCSPT